MNGKPIRVLLADPEPQLLLAYTRFLKTQGFDVATASTFEDCLAKLERWSPDVLVIELETPHHWAEEILARLSAPSEYKLPVLILSRLEPSSVDYPICEYHVKPYSMHELVTSIRRAAGVDVQHIAEEA